MKVLRRLGIFFFVCAIIYFLGPKPATPVLTNSMVYKDLKLKKLEFYVEKKESVWDIKPDNHARIVWYDSSKMEKTKYSIVYLHGFGASQAEGDPVHRTIAETFGSNLYLSRLNMHGLKGGNQLINFTADDLWESAKEALMIGKKLGDKVLLVGTSTGGTLALKLAATFPDYVSGVILLSPNVAIRNSSAWLLNKPWGLQIARAVVGGKYITPSDTSELYRQYWSGEYRVEAAVELQQLISKSMTKSTFKAIEQPLLMLYYYKDKDNQDEVVSVKAMLKMFEKISTPDDLKRQVPVPNAGDHVIGSYIKSNDVETVIDESIAFLEEIMGWERALDKKPEQVKAVESVN